jgi:flagellar protein FlaG
VLAAQVTSPPASEAKAAATQAERRAKAEETRRELQQAVERMNQQAIKDGRKLNFAMDQVTDQMVITVRKAETGEVIRQIPSEAVLRVAHNMEELKGLLHNRTS